MDKNNVNTNATNNNTDAATNNTNPSVMMDDKELMKMKAAYAAFEAENRKNRTFGEKVLESLPYIASGLAIGASGLAIGVSIKALNTTANYINSQTYSPSPDGDLE